MALTVGHLKKVLEELPDNVDILLKLPGQFANDLNPETFHLVAATKIEGQSDPRLFKVTVKGFVASHVKKYSRNQSIYLMLDPLER